MTGTRVRPALSRQGFTLVEIVVSMTVAAVLVGISVPTIRGLQRQHEARQPVAQLVRMARTVRARAMAEQHPYQIAFDREGFHAAEYFSPYGGKELFDELVIELELTEKTRQMAEASEKRLGKSGEQAEQEAVAAETRAGVFYQHYELPAGVRYEIMMRGDHQWVAMNGGEFKRWVFQSSGMCDPFKIRIQSDKAFFEVSFHPLTGDIKEEQSYVD